MDKYREIEASVVSAIVKAGYKKNSAGMAFRHVYWFLENNQNKAESVKDFIEKASKITDKELMIGDGCGRKTVEALRSIAPYETKEIKYKEKEKTTSERDMFAAAALTGLLSNHKLMGKFANGEDTWLAETCYYWADKMIKQRRV